MSKYYIAPTRKGRLLKIVEDVKVPISDKLQKLGRKTEDYLVRQRLVARFVNEQEARTWLAYYEAIDDWLKKFIQLHSILGNEVQCTNSLFENNKLN